MDVAEETQNLTFDKTIKKDKTTKNNNEISINYIMIGNIQNITNVVVDNIFAYNVVVDIISENEDPKPKFLEECRQRKKVVFVKRNKKSTIKLTFKKSSFWTGSLNTKRCQTCGI